MCTCDHRDWHPAPRPRTSFPITKHDECLADDCGMILWQEKECQLPVSLSGGCGLRVAMTAGIVLVDGKSLRHKQTNAFIRPEDGSESRNSRFRREEAVGRRLEESLSVDSQREQSLSWSCSLYDGNHYHPRHPLLSHSTRRFYSQQKVTPVFAFK